MMLLATAAGAEYYQYTDPDGTLRYTDDLYQVPEAQRPAMKTFRSEKSVSSETAAQPPEGDSELQAPEPSEPERSDAAEAMEEAEANEAAGADLEEKTLQETAAELDRMQMELNNTWAALQEERAALKAQAPPKNARTQERIQYSVKVENLNNRIAEYEADLKAFEKNVDAFNDSRNIMRKK
jgi:predicted RNase H-like nuclease (RuvC/YqgF family)